MTALLPSAVKGVKCKLHHINRRHKNTPAVLPARRTCQGVETAKAEGEMEKPYFLHMAGLIVSDIRCIILFQCNFKIYTTFELTQ